MAYERLNTEQLAELAKRHPHANKTNFMERVSKVIITKDTNWNLVVKLNELGVDAELVEKDN